MEGPLLRSVVRVGCGAGFQGDRVPPAVSLVQYGNLDYLVLECLAERTLMDSIERMRIGGKGYDTRLAEWMNALLPVCYSHHVTLITNMGAADPEGAGKEAALIASSLGIPIRIATIHEVEPKHPVDDGVACTYLGADSIIDALKEGAQLVIAGRVADPSLFVAPVVHSFGWSLKKDFHLIAQATLGGHLLECGAHLTGGYFAHPKGRNLGFKSLANLSLPFFDMDSQGHLILGKLEGSSGELSERTCKQQLTYEIHNPKAYITPDVIVDFSQVTFTPLSPHAIVAQGATATSRPKQLLRLVAKSAGVKAWAEVSYGGNGCVKRAFWAAQLVSKWMEERQKGVMEKVMIYLLGFNSLYLTPGPFPSHLGALHTFDDHETENSCCCESKQCTCQVSKSPPEARLRFDGLFDNQQNADALGMDLQALNLSGPAGGGGFIFGTKRDVAITKLFIDRSKVKWRCMVFNLGDRGGLGSSNGNNHNEKRSKSKSQQTLLGSSSHNRTPSTSIQHTETFGHELQGISQNGFKISYQVPLGWTAPSPPPQSRDGKILLYDIAHSRSGDKGDTANISVIPYNPNDLHRLIKVITPEWVYKIYKPLLTGDNPDIQIHILHGPCALNITLYPALDGGVSVSRRIDRHGKTLSDLILNQWVHLPPIQNAKL